MFSPVKRGGFSLTLIILFIFSLHELASPVAPHTSQSYGEKYLNIFNDNFALILKISLFVVV